MIQCVLSFHGIDISAPFLVNENTTELVVTRSLDREEKEVHELLLICTVTTESKVHKMSMPILVNVYDEDDSAPYVNGTDTEDVRIEFNRMEVS